MFKEIEALLDNTAYEALLEKRVRENNDAKAKAELEKIRDESRQQARLMCEATAKARLNMMSDDEKWSLIAIEIHNRHEVQSLKDAFERSQMVSQILHSIIATKKTQEEIESWRDEKALEVLKDAITDAFTDELKKKRAKDFKLKFGDTL